MEVNLRNTLNGHQNPVYTLVVDSENQLLYSAGNDKGIVEWDLKTDAFKRVLCTVSASVYCLCLIPNSNLLVAGLRNGDVFVVTRDGEQASLKAKLRLEKGAVFALQYLAAKNELLAIGEQGQAYVWNFESFDLLYQFEVSKNTVRTIALSVDNKYLAFGDKDGFIAVHDANDFHQISRAKIHDQGVSSLAFLDKYLLSGGRDAKLNKLEIPSLKVIDSIVPHMFTVYGIQSLSVDLFSTVSRDKTIKIWNADLKLQKNISRDKGIESHLLSINTQAFDSNQKMMATAGDDKVIKLWQLA